MPRDGGAYLWDAERAAGQVLDFPVGRPLDDLTGALLLRSAVERQLRNMGEALAQVAQVSSALAARFPLLDQIVASGDALVNHYYQGDASAWMTATQDVPFPRSQLQAELREVAR